MTEPAVTRGVKWDLNLSLLLTAINIIGATVWWLSMPQRLKTLEGNDADKELRLRLLESKSSSTESMLSRIDERTKNMESNIQDMRHDWSMRYNGNPIK